MCVIAAVDDNCAGMLNGGISGNGLMVGMHMVL